MPKKGLVEKEKRCFKCQEQGHIARNCWQGFGKVIEQDEKRRLAGRCGKCAGGHQTVTCHINEMRLICDYPPCTNRVGHIAPVCPTMMGRCRHTFCHNARGHSVDSHNVIRADGKRWGIEAARRAFRKDPQVFRYRLTCLLYTSDADDE